MQIHNKFHFAAWTNAIQKTHVWPFSRARAFPKSNGNKFANFPWLIIFIDDILISAKNSEELRHRTNLVHQRLPQYNILINTAKAEYGVTELNFIGYCITVHGISATKNKLEAIEILDPPKSTEEVRSFLGLVNFVNRYIPHMATITNPLNQLTHKRTKFYWNSCISKHFNQI